MASHRRTKAATRAVLSLAATTTAVGAAGVVLGPAPSRAASTADIKSQIATLDAQAEQATNAYDQAVEQLAQLQKQVDDLQGQAAETRASMTVLMQTLGPIAAQQYRSGSVDPSLELLLNGTPDTYIQKALTNNQVEKSVALSMKQLQLRQIQLTQLQKEAADRLAQLRQTESDAAATKVRIVTAVREKENLMAQLTYTQAQTLATGWVTASQIANLPQVGGRAGVAVAFAKSKIGMWYQWGGTGNPSYDCSGLTQAAWKAAGVTLGRTTYDQVNDGVSVPAVLADLQPGDLILYNDNEHMAIYVGNGVVVHAPTTGQKIQYAPWNMLPIDSVRRVG
jgi:cell wall-associated NlpC family hydrolase